MAMGSVFQPKIVKEIDLLQKSSERKKILSAAIINVINSISEMKDDADYLDSLDTYSGEFPHDDVYRFD